MFLGPALCFDATTQRCDLAFDGTDLVLDLTPATTMLVMAGSDRRAHTDDVLPQPQPNPYAPTRLNARRGYPGDALDPNGKLCGSRFWLLRGMKQTEATRRFAESAAAEGFADFESLWSMPVTITVRWVMRNMLGFLLVVGQQQMNLSLPVGS